MAEQINTGDNQGTSPVADSIQKLRDEMARIEQQFGNTDAFKQFQDEMASKGNITGKKAQKRNVERAEKQFKNYAQKLDVSPEFTAADCNLVRYFLIRALQSTGTDIVLAEFAYKNCFLDLFAVTAGRAMEFEVKASREDYFKDFEKKMFTGVPVNKHGLIAAGKTIISKFYFVVPANMVDVRECPQHAGLIWYELLGDVPIFRVVKPAPLLCKEYLQAGTWMLISQRLMVRCRNLQDRYINNKFKSIERNSDYAYSNTYDKATDKRKVNAR